MKVFVDTSALFALLDSDDINHQSAKDKWLSLLQTESNLITTNYIIIESMALIQRRLGLKALRTFQEGILPIFQIYWIQEDTHNCGVAALLTASRKMLSLVDCISFHVMSKHSIKNAFTFDKHFKQEGFHCLDLI